MHNLGAQGCALFNFLNTINRLGGLMKLKSLGILVLSVFLFACGGTPSKEEVTKSIKQILPIDFEIVQINKMKEVPGLVEIVLKLDKQHIIFYMDNKAKYIVSGSIVETATKKNLTLERQNAFNPPTPQMPPQQQPAEPKEQQKPTKKK